MTRVVTTGIAGLKSETFYPMPPVEWGRAGGTVTAITVVGNGGSGATSQAGPLATTVNRTGGSGLTVSTTAAAGVVTAIGVTVGGDGYRLGDLITVTGANGATATTGRVTGLSYTN